MNEADLYIGREQTLIKHFIFQRYLQKFAYIIGSWAKNITYVDGFSGPWNQKSSNLADSSFVIALTELKNARDTLRGRNKDCDIRCFFIEKNAKAYAKLEEYAVSARADGTAIETRNCEFEDAIDDVVKFVKAGGSSTFPFIFIDPKGWAGFAMDTLTPLLKLKPVEVLINFQTYFISRFLESPDAETQQSFERLFGSTDFKARVAGLASDAREEAAIEEYSEKLKQRGEFKYVCRAIVLRSVKDQTHYHLIYATRDARGVEVFKEAERAAASVMEGVRAEAKKRRAEEKSEQLELSAALHQSPYLSSLRQKYCQHAKNRVEELLRTKRRVTYDEVWDSVMTVPLVWESDLKEWVKMWRDGGQMDVDGFDKRQKVPKRDSGNILIWKNSSRSVATVR